MRLVKSKYTRIVFVTEDVWFVHNLASGAECLINDKEKEALEKMSDFRTEQDPVYQEWYDLGILVDADIDEDACLELERKISAYSSIKDQFGIVIAPTMDCNARCFYCYENDTRACCYMDADTEKALIEYIKRMAFGKKKVFISWFGGEPLLCFDLIRRVSEEITALCDANGIAYEAELTTNGFYLGKYRDVFQQLRITDTQITLDGFGAEHEKRKNYRDGENAWDVTIDNIFSFSSDGHHITIRMNFDRSNIEGVMQTTRMLLNDPRWNQNISIYYYPLEPVGCDSSVYYRESEYADVMEQLYMNLYENGYYDNRADALGFHKMSLPCYGATLGTTAVDYKGNIYHCQHLLCHEEMAIGNVETGIKITDDVLKWYDGKLPDSCRDCQVVPLCQGGCVTKRNLGQECYLCHMLKYRIDSQEKMKVRLLKKQFHLI